MKFSLIFMMAIALVHSFPQGQGNDADNCDSDEKIRCEEGYNEDRVDPLRTLNQCRPITCRSQKDLLDTYQISAIGRSCRLLHLFSGVCDNNGNCQRCGA